MFAMYLYCLARPGALAAVDGLGVDGERPLEMIPFREVVAVVSTGTGGVDVTFPRVDRVIGTREPKPHWYEERPAIHGRYGVSHLHDYYGAGRQGCLDF